jgi:hypothetical protein
MVLFPRRCAVLSAVSLVLWVPVARAADPGAADHGVLQPRPGFRDAVTAPLEDFNLKTMDIPDVLVRARAAPYSLDGLDHCEAIAGELGRLNEVLGPDVEEAPPPDRRSAMAKAAGQAHGAAVDAVQGEAHGVIPLRSWLRKLTGADANTRKLIAAARAGDIRRGYLKGVGMRMNCAPPAAPSWFVPSRGDKTLAGPSSPPFWRPWWEAFLAWLRGLGWFGG